MSALSFLRDHCGYHSLDFVETVQSLWGGYGAIERWRCDQQMLIVKRITPPDMGTQDQGEYGELDHRRKLKSYQVEQYWYQQIRQQKHLNCHIPRLIAAKTEEVEQYLLLEDLHAQGFDCHVTAASNKQIEMAVDWLAQFHGRFLGACTDGLWQKGNYWHLDTRPAEWTQMEDLKLQGFAGHIDKQLKSAQYQTLIHGDAKLANFGFAADNVAAIDFQYVGGGIGVEDLAYFLGSCLHETQLREQTDFWLNRYFSTLASVLQDNDIDPAPIETEWRSLYEVAQADFARFLNGWSPQHWKVNGVLSQSVDRVLAQYN